MSDEEESKTETSSDSEPEEPTTSSSSSDTDDEIIQDIPDEEFFKTLSCLKTKDPRIYDSNVQFFTKPPLIINNNKSDKSEEVSEQPKLETEKKQNNKFSLRDLDADSSSEDEMSAFKRIPEQTPTEPKTENENDYVKFLKGEKSQIEDKDTESSLKPLLEFWTKNELDEKEKFLKDYILGKKYLGSAPSLKTDETNLSEDERELEEQAEYETNYNFRFENDENVKLKRFPRNVEGSMRKKDDSRKRKRAERNQRKKEEKLKKQQEIKKKQKEKLSEIEEQVQKLKELTGNPELGFKDDEILEDFDPVKHDKKMQELFNEDYYREGEEEHPVFDEGDEGYWDTGEVNMDCEADLDGTGKDKLTRSQRKKMKKKKKTYKDIMDVVKPAFDPKVHSDFKKYIDEYYSLDCEDFIEDIPCKFKYREVVPNDFGLSIEEILMADDKELNRWASVRKITKRLPEHVEKNEVKIYRQKARDEYLKKKVLPSLFKEPEEEVKDEQTSNENKKRSTQDAGVSQEDGDSTQPSKKSKKKIKTEPLSDSNIIENNESLNAKTVEQTIPVKTEDKPENIEGENSAQSPKAKNKRKKKKKKHNNETTMENSSTVERSDTKPMNGHVNSGGSKNLKKRRKKKKKNKAQNPSQDTSSTPSGSSKGISETFKKENSFKHPNKQESNKNNVDKIRKITKKNATFKKKKKEGVVNLSDSRLLAYGIKPKQFRSKLIYSQKKEGS